MGEYMGWTEARMKDVEVSGFWEWGSGAFLGTRRVFLRDVILTKTSFGISAEPSRKVWSTITLLDFLGSHTSPSTIVLVTLVTLPPVRDFSNSDGHISSRCTANRSPWHIAASLPRFNSYSEWIWGTDLAPDHDQTCCGVSRVEQLQTVGGQSKGLARDRLHIEVHGRERGARVAWPSVLSPTDVWSRQREGFLSGLMDGALSERKPEQTPLPTTISPFSRPNISDFACDKDINDRLGGSTIRVECGGEEMAVHLKLISFQIKNTLNTPQNGAVIFVRDSEMRNRPSGNSSVMERRRFITLTDIIFESINFTIEGDGTPLNLCQNAILAPASWVIMGLSGLRKT
ncbi:hypothetical protein DFP72DRAFT_848865 [Ephemerocybe angulata]|uniref:Uncharacterized protein n=1 Tax=Ephemerocybe angulata TaxID=980116 RepID=A0A8H6M3U2_9AGAR|nr:hypothetical protein DFP72DRAFT_848865 [Tulosesus angulatus]